MRFLRGAELADRGVVSDVAISQGELRGSVSGSRREAYSVKITTPVTGASMGVGSQIRWSCTCPDWGDPCKHAIALLLVASLRLDDDPDLLATLVGSDSEVPPPDSPVDIQAEIPETQVAARVRKGPTTTVDAPVIVPARSTGLPTVAPLWAEALGVVDYPATIHHFFGMTSAGTTTPTAPSTESPSSSSSSSSTGMTIGTDRLRQLGPLIVDDYDLAPDIIHMYTALRED